MLFVRKSGNQAICVGKRKNLFPMIESLRLGIAVSGEKFGNSRNTAGY